MSGRRYFEGHPAGDWAEQAACVGYPTRWWYPSAADPHRSHARQALTPQSQRAIAICQECPVRVECLGWADRSGEIDGILGGLLPHQRNPHRPHRLPIPHGTPAGYNGHYRRNEPACESCLEAKRIYTRERAS